MRKVRIQSLIVFLSSSYEIPSMGGEEEKIEVVTHGMLSVIDTYQATDSIQYIESVAWYEEDEV